MSVFFGPFGTLIHDGGTGRTDPFCMALPRTLKTLIQQFLQSRIQLIPRLHLFITSKIWISIQTRFSFPFWTLYVNEHLIIQLQLVSFLLMGFLN